MGLVRRCGHGKRQAHGCQAGKGGEKPCFRETSLWCLDQGGDSLFSGGSSELWCTTRQGPTVVFPLRRSGGRPGGLHSPRESSLTPRSTLETGLQHAHVLLLPCFWVSPGSVPSSASTLFQPLPTDTPDGALPMSAHLQPGHGCDSTVGGPHPSGGPRGTCFVPDLVQRVDGSVLGARGGGGGVFCGTSV